MPGLPEGMFIEGNLPAGSAGGNCWPNCSVRSDSVMGHTAYSQEGVFDSCHFFLAQRGERPLSEPGTVERPRLIHNHLAIFQQAAAGCDGYSPLLEGGVNLGGHGQDDYHGRSDSGECIVLKDQHGADFANLPSARRIQVGNPDFSASHHFHHFSPGLPDLDFPALRPSAASSASLSNGRNSSAISSASRRMSLFEYAARASSTSWFMKRLFFISVRYHASASRATSERVRFSRCASWESCWSIWSVKRRLSVVMMCTFMKHELYDRS